MRCASQSCVSVSCFFFFFKQKTAYEMRISDWSSDVCSSDLHGSRPCLGRGRKRGDAANAFGRSRGGFTCKIHARSDNQGRPLGFLLTGGEASDYTAAEDRKSTRLKLQSLMRISYAVFCLKQNNEI